jgi:hypothetical protein
MGLMEDLGAWLDQKKKNAANAGREIASQSVASPTGAATDYARGSAAGVGDMLDLFHKGMYPATSDLGAGSALRGLLGNTGSATEEAGGLFGFPGAGTAAKFATKGLLPMAAMAAIKPAEYGLKVNKDGTVSLFHATTKDAAGKIVQEKKLRSKGEPEVFMSNSPEGVRTSYGDGTVVRVDVPPSRITLNDEFPGGRYDFSMPARTMEAPVARASIWEPPRELTPFELAHAEAQRNAALPVAQGGLGLGPQNTAMERAKAMGFDADAYHGSPTPFINEIRGDGSATGAKSAVGNVFASDVPAVAETYTGLKTAIGNKELRKQIRMVDNQMWQVIDDSAAWNRDYQGQLAKKLELAKEKARLTELADNAVRPTMYPLKIKSGGLFSSDAGGKLSSEIDMPGLMEWSQDRGGVKISNVIDAINMDRNFANSDDALSTIFAISDPTRIRSRFAAFDPKKRDSRDLLASMGLLGLLGAGAYGQEQ